MAAQTSAASSGRAKTSSDWVGVYPPEKRTAVVSCFSEAVVKAVEISQLFEVPLPDSRTWADVLGLLLSPHEPRQAANLELGKGIAGLAAVTAGIVIGLVYYYR